MAARLALFQRLIQIGDKIVDILDPNRYPHQTIRYAEPRPLLRRKGRMRHDGGMLDPAFNPAQAFSQCEDLAAFEKTSRIGHSALHDRRNHPAETMHLALSQRM